MASRLAQQAAAHGLGPKSKASKLYQEVCRCLPFIARLHKLEEVSNLRELRAIVKSRFHEFKDVKDPRAADLLIFKGREELEITEYLEPYADRNMHLKAKTNNSAFLDSFFTTAYPQIARKS